MTDMAYVSDLKNPTKPESPWWTKMAISRKELFELAHDVDPGICKPVVILNMFNFTTLQSCEGRWDLDGDNAKNYLGEHEHTYLEPTVDFDGTINDGFRAYAILSEHGLKVNAFRREWRIIDGEPTGPIWSFTFDRRFKPMTDKEIEDLLEFYEL